MKDKTTALIWQFRMVYYAIVLTVLIGVLGPILYKIPEYPFLWDNLLFIVVFAVFIQWIFFLRFSWFGKRKFVKLTILFLVVPIMIGLLDRFTAFQSYLDELGLQTFMEHLSFTEEQFFLDFIRNEMLFFGVASIIAAIIVGFRMIVSLWRYSNKGTI